MRRTLYVLSLALLLYVPAARADPVTFEGLTTVGAEDITQHNQGYAGFIWDQSWFLYRGRSYTPPGSMGEYAIVNNFGRDPLGFQASAPFDFHQVLIAQWSFNAPSTVRIRGYRGTNLVGDTGDLRIGPAFAAFSPNFVGVTRVDFVGGRYFALDNLVVDPAPVPEPGSLLLFGTGAAALGRAVWRRRRGTAHAR